jgi:flagellar biosynthesis GTPase FlhF
MKVVPFVAESAATALAQIHEQLGPDAVVLSVRPLPKHGLARFWQKSQAVEVIACVKEAGDEPVSDLLTGVPSGPESFIRSTFSAPAGPIAPALHDGSGRPHVFIGPPGVGKTTLLCKWMTVSVLNENRTAQVWRLDGAGANTAEFLNIYGEMLGIPIERFWAPGSPSAELLLVDLPGVQPDDSNALGDLTDQLSRLPNPRVHLVLNAAYETTILVEQFRAFARFRPEDLSFSHLDEEKRPGKLMDFLMGTNCSLRFLSTGQKVPGDFIQASEAPVVCAESAG